MRFMWLCVLANSLNLYLTLALALFPNRTLVALYGSIYTELCVAEKDTIPHAQFEKNVFVWGWLIRLWKEAITILSNIIKDIAWFKLLCFGLDFGTDTHSHTHILERNKMIAMSFSCSFSLTHTVAHYVSIDIYLSIHLFQSQGFATTLLLLLLLAAAAD